MFEVLWLIQIEGIDYSEVNYHRFTERKDKVIHELSYLKHELRIRDEYYNKLKHYYFDVNPLIKEEEKTTEMFHKRLYLLLSRYVILFWLYCIDIMH